MCTSVLSPGHALRYERYGLGLGRNVEEGSGAAGPHRFHRGLRVLRAAYDAVLVGTHNASQVDRWPLVAALCRELRKTA
jgi:hypothetical protein